MGNISVFVVGIASFYSLSTRGEGWGEVFFDNLIEEIVSVFSYESSCISRLGDISIGITDDLGRSLILWS